MHRALALSLLAAACGGVNSAADAPPAPPDALIDSDWPHDDGPSPDAPVARCSPTARFGTPVPLSALNSTAAEGPIYLTADELTAYFASTRAGGPGGYDIYVATRATTASAFSTPSLLNGVNSADTESRPVLTADGLTLYAEVKRGAAPYHLERATRTSTSGSFSALSPVTALNSASSDVAPYVLPDHRAIYFVSGRGGDAAIYRSEGTGGTWGTPVLATGTNLQSPQSEDYPAITDDELTIVFTSGRPGGTGGSDLYLAKRTSLAVGFDAPVELTEINTASDEQPGWLSPDGCILYFSRAGDLFVATRGP